MSTVLYALGRFAYRNRLKVIAVWVVILAALAICAATLSKPAVNNFSISNIPSQRATDLIKEKFPENNSDPFTTPTLRLVFKSLNGTKLTDPQNVKAIDDVIAAAKRLPGGDPAQQVSNPAVPPAAPDSASELSEQQRVMLATHKAINSTKTPQQAEADQKAASPLSHNGTIAYLTIKFAKGVSLSDLDTKAKDVDSSKTMTDFINDAVAKGTEASHNIEVEAAGNAAESQAPPNGIAELIGIIVAAIVLILTFASLVAAGLPLINAIVGVGVSLTAITALTHWLQLGQFSSILTSMIGLAVAIDYALFILSRFRNELTRVEDRAEAAGRAVGTAGSAVIFAGITVIIALAALATTGISFLIEMGLCAAFGVLVAVCIAISLLPAVLGLIGTKAFAGRIRGLHAPDNISLSQQKATGASTATEHLKPPTSNGRRWIHLISKAPAIGLIVAVVLLGVIAIPAKNLQLALPNAGTEAKDKSPRKAYDILSEGFGPGFNGPLLVAVDGSKIHGTDPNANPFNQRIDAYAQLVKDIHTKNTDDVANVQIANLSNMAPNAPAGSQADAAIITVIPKFGPTDQRTKDLVNHLRDQEGEAQSTLNVSYGVAGQTAMELDISKKLQDALVPYLAIVVALAFILLMVVFRSLLVPLTAAVGFCLTIAATFGATVAIFQKGWFGIIDNTAPLVSFMPIFMIGVVFGLAMDYQVFLVSRMREDYVHGGRNSQSARAAVISGFSHGARVVSAAAVIMISVFAAFMLEDAAFIKAMGFALASAVLFDAFVVRMLFIPSIMFLMGKAAWWIPSWLNKILPNLDIEGENLMRKLDARQQALGKNAADPTSHPSSLAGQRSSVPALAASDARPISSDELNRALLVELSNLRNQYETLATDITAMRQGQTTVVEQLSRLHREPHARPVFTPTQTVTFTLSNCADAHAASHRARAGVISTPRGDITTPAYLPTIFGAGLSVLSRESAEFAVIADTDQLRQRISSDAIAAAGGLSAFVGTNHPTLAHSRFDSGSQLLIELAGQPGRHVTPEGAMQIAHQIGADITFVYQEDVPLYPGDDSEHGPLYQREAGTIAAARDWSSRSLAEFSRMSTLTGSTTSSLWGVIHGGRFADLRAESARYAIEASAADKAAGGIGLSGVGIVGDLPRNILAELLTAATDVLPLEVPRHLSSLAEPEDIFAAVSSGIDTVESQSPARHAANGYLYTNFGRVDVTDPAHSHTHEPLDDTLRSELASLSRSYLLHLYNNDRDSAVLAFTAHNELFMARLVERVRESLVEGVYDEFRAEFLECYFGQRRESVNA